MPMEQDPLTPTEERAMARAKAEKAARAAALQRRRLAEIESVHYAALSASRAVEIDESPSECNSEQRRSD